MNKITALLFVLMTILSMPNNIQAQTFTFDLNGGVNTIFTALPFLRINPDGRSGGMGDLGIATSPDAASIYYNAAKLTFAEDKTGFSATYTPWLRQLVPDMFISQLTGYTQLNDRNAIGGSIRYFNFGSIQFTDAFGLPTGTFNPYEFAADLGYAKKITPDLSIGLSLKYAYSNLAGVITANGPETFDTKTIAADISTYYQKEVNWMAKSGTFSAGIAITNIGNKVSYTNDAITDFIPTNLGIGTAYTMNLNNKNTIMVGIDFNKLLVPTPDTLFLDGDPNIPDHREKSLISGMFGSTFDAPGGTLEELREVSHSIGIEYWHKQIFALRAGRFYEHRTKGNRQYFTFGASFRYRVVGINVSYLVSTAETINIAPMDKTYRVSLFLGLPKDDNG